MSNISPYKNWMGYEKYLQSGEWHVHTDYVDGENSVDEYCKRAVELRIPLIVFTEHVRRVLTYNYQDLVEEIMRARENYPELIILTGCEAKVLENGSLDDEEVEVIFEIASQKNVLIELNEKYSLPSMGWVEIGKKKGVKFVRGSDVHRVEELK